MVHKRDIRPGIPPRVIIGRIEELDLFNKNLQSVVKQGEPLPATGGLIPLAIDFDPSLIGDIITIKTIGFTYDKKPFFIFFKGTVPVPIAVPSGDYWILAKDVRTSITRKLRFAMGITLFREGGPRAFGNVIGQAFVSTNGKITGWIR